ncbi:MAG: hypothetical protein ACKVII_14615 [Planctomycetales bacterium]|jgi:hypothetical protein
MNEPTSDESASTTDETASPADETVSQGHTATNPVVRFLGMIVAGAVATGISYAAVASVGELYQIPQELLALGMPSAEELDAIDAARVVADTGNAMTWLAITGAIFGGVLALVSGLLRRAGKGIAIGTVAAILAAAGLGYLSGNLAISNFEASKANAGGNDLSPEHETMIMHGITWGLIGLGVGVGCGLARPKIEAKPVLVSAIVAGVMGCVAGGVFPITLGIAAPLENSINPVPISGVGRMFWMGLASLLISAGLGRTD